MLEKIDVTPYCQAKKSVCMGGGGEMYNLAFFCFPTH